MKTNLIIKLMFLLSLFLGTFSDEAIQTIIAFKVSQYEKTYLISFIFIAGFIGAILSSIFANRITNKFSINNIVISIFILEAFFIFITPYASSMLWYIFISFILGALGSLIWSCILILVPSFTKNDKELERVNKIIHVLRNLGYVIGPALGGLLYGTIGLLLSSIVIAISTLFSAVLIFFTFFHTKKINSEYKDPSEQSKDYTNGIMAVKQLMQQSVLRKAITPLIFTIITTSMMTTLMVTYLLNILKLNSEYYGYTGTISSIGLIVGPLFFARLFNWLGNASGASLAALCIGLGQLIISFSTNFILIGVIFFIIGIANGIQNMLMSVFMMKNIDATKRKIYMPAYILILQSSVLIGFILSIFVTIDTLHIAFIISGIITICAGVIGIIINDKYKN